MQFSKALAIGFLATGMSLAAHADTTREYTYCYKMPRTIGGDLARIKAEYVIEKKGSTNVRTKLKAIAILSGRGLDYAYVDERARPLVSTGTIGLFSSVPMPNGAMVENLKLVSPTWILSSSPSARDMNKKVEKATGVNPARPRLQAFDNRMNAKNAVVLDIAPVKCPTARKGK